MRVCGRPTGASMRSHIVVLRAHPSARYARHGDVMVATFIFSRRLEARALERELVLTAKLAQERPGRPNYENGAIVTGVLLRQTNQKLSGYNQRHIRRPGSNSEKSGATSAQRNLLAVLKFVATPPCDNLSQTFPAYKPMLRFPRSVSRSRAGGEFQLRRKGPTSRNWAR